MEERRKSHRLESVLIVVAAAALIAVILANVIRVKVSPDAAVATRAIFFGASWIAAIAWAAAAGRRSVLVWLGALAGCGALIVLCQSFAGGVSGSSLLYLIGPGGAGIGVGILIQRSLAANPAWSAWGAALFGFLAAAWLALEPGMELWKLLPNDWEVSKGLEYRWGIRMGEERARFLFDSPMEAGVVQWFLGSLCLATAVTKSAGAVTRRLLGAAAVLLFASVALTYSRAGLALAALSIGLAVLMSIRSKRATILALFGAGLAISIAAIAASRIAEGENAAMKNVASILDPSEEANRIRISQFTKLGRDLAETPWHGKGASTFVTFQEAPRMPDHESAPVGLIVAFGVGGWALALALVRQIVRRWSVFMDVIVNKTLACQNAFACFVGITAWPFALYSLVAPVLSGIIFGMMCFTIIGLLLVWNAPLRAGSGKP